MGGHWKSDLEIFGQKTCLPWIRGWPHVARGDQPLDPSNQSSRLTFSCGGLHRRLSTRIDGTESMDLIAVVMKLRCIASRDRGNTIKHSKRARRNGHEFPIIGTIAIIVAHRS